MSNRLLMIFLVLMCPILLNACGGGGGGGVGGGNSPTPTTPLSWDQGTWDQVIWN